MLVDFKFQICQPLKANFSGSEDCCQPQQQSGVTTLQRRRRNDNGRVTTFPCLKLQLSAFEKMLFKPQQLVLHLPQKILSYCVEFPFLEFPPKCNNQMHAGQSKKNDRHPQKGFSSSMKILFRLHYSSNFKKRVRLCTLDPSLIVLAKVSLLIFNWILNPSSSFLSSVVSGENI